MIINTNLPIEEVIPDIRNVFENGRNAVLEAPPGAGKTTLVPLALINELWLKGRHIVMLEPRRLAAKAAAMRMADLLGEEVGNTVGYRTRLDTRVGPSTRIEVVIEGILTKFLQSDPSLDGIGLVIFDEFHERSIHADLGLALCLESQTALREDLKVLVMSATLDGREVASLLGNTPVVKSEGRSFPVETRYLPESRLSAREADYLTGPTFISTVSNSIIKAFRDENGSILVFLPGGSEIRRVEPGRSGRAKSRNPTFCKRYIAKGTGTTISVQCDCSPLLEVESFCVQQRCWAEDVGFRSALPDLPTHPNPLPCSGRGEYKNVVIPLWQVNPLFPLTALCGAIYY